MKSYKLIKAEIDALSKQAEAAKAKESADAIAKVKDLIETYGLTAAQLGLEVGAKRGGKVKRAGSAAKYKDPVSGKTWNGVGKRPRWIVEAKGDLSKFLIGGTSAAAKTEANAVAPATKSKVTKSAPKAKRKVAAKVAAKAAKPAAKQEVAKQDAAKPASDALKAPAKKMAAKKPAAKKVVVNKPAGTKPVAKVEAGAAAKAA